MKPPTKGQSKRPAVMIWLENKRYLLNDGQNAQLEKSTNVCIVIICIKTKRGERTNIITEKRIIKSLVFVANVSLFMPSGLSPLLYALTGC